MAPYKAYILLTVSALSLAGLGLGLKLTQPWSAQGEQANDRFGAKVAPAGDLNGDGYADLAVWAENHQRSRGKVYVYLGGPRGPRSTPAFAVAGEGPTDQYGHSFGGMGDVDGDGYGNFLVAAQNFGGRGKNAAGKAYLYKGGPQGPASVPVWSRVGEQGDLFGDCSAPVGDVNRDGHADVIIGAYGFDGFRGRAHLFHGSPSGLGQQPEWTVQGEQVGDWFGYSVAMAGDLNGDGHVEIAIGAKNAALGSLPSVGKTYVYCGGPKGYSTKPCWSASGEGRGDYFGWRAVAAGDVNGDGYDDLAVSAYRHSAEGSPSGGKVYVYCGGPQGLGPQPCWSAAGTESAAFFGVSLAGGDFNGDGYSDLLVGCPGCGSGGRVYLYVGGPQGLSPQPAWSAIGDPGEDLGTYVANAGDVNGDGLPDVLVGAPKYSAPDRELTGRVLLYYGRKDGRLSRKPPLF